MIGADALRTRLVSINGPLNPAGVPSIEDNATDTHYVNVSTINQFNSDSTIGIGVKNPRSTLFPFGLKLDVAGGIRADEFLANDIKFHKDGRLLWRMFEEESGLYVENALNGEISRVSFDRDTKPLQEEIFAQRLELESLKQEKMGRC